MKDENEDLLATRSLLKMLRQPVSNTLLSRFEKTLLIAIGLILLSALALSVLLTAGVLPENARPMISSILQIVVLLVGCVWIIAQLIGAATTIYRGQAGIAQDVDAKIRHEEALIAALAKLDPDRLQRRSEMLGITAKRITRHISRTGLLAALGVVLIKLHEAGMTNSLWPKIDHADIFIYAGSVGIAIGSISMLGVVSSIERLASLLGLAAEEAKQGI